MYGDTAVIRRLAADLREQGAELRLEAARLVAAADAVEWRGRASEAMRSHMRESASDLGRTANDHDEAAEALIAHANEVDRLKDLIAAIEAKVTGLLADAASTASSIAGKVVDGVKKIAPDSLEGNLSTFDPPSPGSKDWLDVDIPGVNL